MKSIYKKFCLRFSKRIREIGSCVVSSGNSFSKVEDIRVRSQKVFSRQCRIDAKAHVSDVAVVALSVLYKITPRTAVNSRESFGVSDAFLVDFPGSRMAANVLHVFNHLVSVVHVASWLHIASVGVKVDGSSPPQSPQLGRIGVNDLHESCIAGGNVIEVVGWRIKIGSLNEEILNLLTNILS